MIAIQRQTEMMTTLNQYRDAYYNHSNSIVSDAVYDRLLDELTALEKETGVIMANSPTQTVGYAPVSALPKVRHEIPLLSQAR